jgi:hypothetical protein
MFSLPPKEDDRVESWQLAMVDLTRSGDAYKASLLATAAIRGRTLIELAAC